MRSRERPRQSPGQLGLGPRPLQFHQENRPAADAGREVLFQTMGWGSGGPRAGNGAAERCAMREGGISATTSPRGSEGAATTGATAGGAEKETHSGQSSVWPLAGAVPPSDFTTSFTAPAPEHTSSIACGLTIGDAMATPSVNANHASTRRARKVA